MTFLSIAETRRLLLDHQSTVRDEVAATLRAIGDTDPGLGAYLRVASDEALRAAEANDLLIRVAGADAWRDRPLLGVTVAVKDLIQTADLPTTRGSRLANDRPDVDAPVVARLRAAGAVVVGKTTTSEYGWSASTVSRVAPPTRNPWDRSRTAGGSSGGSAAAVAAGLCTVALGTDGAGSIRIPAAFCGVVGYKPSFGRVPYVPPCADRLSHLGPIGRTVADVAAVADVIAGFDVGDPDSGVAWPEVERQPSRLRVGWLEFPGTADEVRSVSERLHPVLGELGHRLERLDLPFDDPYPALVDTLAAADAAGTSAADEELCDPGRLAIVRYGRTVTGAAVSRAEETRLRLRAGLGAVWGRYDLLAMATVPIEPFDVDAIAPAWAADPAELRWLAWSPATYPFNMTGQPAISLPVGLTSAGLPVGVQLVGPVGGDRLLLAAAAQIEALLSPLPALPEPATKG